jgi:hypothetical protein
MIATCRGIAGAYAGAVEPVTAEVVCPASLTGVHDRAALSRD